MSLSRPIEQSESPVAITDVAVAPDKARAPGLLDLIERILKDREGLHWLIRQPALQAELLPRFLAIALAGFAFYGVAMTVVLQSAGVWPVLTDMAVWLDRPGLPLIAFRETELSAPWRSGAALILLLAYTFGLIATTGVCLPSLYFYGLLSGIRMSMVDVTIHALKSKATSAIALVGILPVYAAVSMGMVIFDAPRPLLQVSLLVGLILPFVAGLWGTHSLYVGFTTLCDTLPDDRRERRECFLRRLVFSWSAIYTAIGPVMIFTIWEALN